MNARKIIRRNRGAIGVALAGAALLVGGAVAQPAAAAEIPWGQANFYTGADFTGTVYPIPATGSDAECINLPEPMKSIANFKYAYVDVFSGTDCTHGFGRITGLHGGTLGIPAVSYKVLVSYPPVRP
ncbi:hypothetical protein OG206_01180 [Streptomyces sp. NBC_01341]|uniref:hypothetical protein n=1 Tax=Streptomyces sp. NBC_01341 TaxID=2903831 RepID=UPI002E119AD7|nr:hypothetical protein OG206_01180 [Streptomyces sp. NBC_01341]